MPNVFVDSFHLQVSAVNGNTGYVNTAIVHGEKVPALVDIATDEEIQVAGGRAEKGGVRATVARDDFTNPPKQGDSASATIGNEESLSGTVLSIKKIHDLWTLLIGDPAAMDRRATNLR